MRINKKQFFDPTSGYKLRDWIRYDTFLKRHAAGKINLDRLSESGLDPQHILNLDPWLIKGGGATRVYVLVGGGGQVVAITFLDMEDEPFWKWYLPFFTCKRDLKVSVDRMKWIWFTIRFGP